MRIFNKLILTEMKKIIFPTVLLLILWQLTFAQDTEVDPMQAVINPGYYSGTDAMFDLLRNHNLDSLTGSIYGYGVVWTGGYYVSSSFNANMFYRATSNWVKIDQFSVTGSSLPSGNGFRDMEYVDGYLWGVAPVSPGRIYKVDLTSRTEVGTINLPGGVLPRCLAWDPVRNGFWVSTNSFAGNLQCYDMNGSPISGATIPTVAGGFYGIAYDDYTAGGPYLWISKDPVAGNILATMYVRYNINSSPYRVDSGMVQVPLTSVPSGSMRIGSGGCDFRINLVLGKSVLLTVIQGAPDRVIAVEVGSITGIHKNSEVASGFYLGTNYPNPFNPSTKINFSVPVAGNVKLSVYDLLGNEVKTLINGFTQKGSYTVNLNAAGFSSGVYFYTMTAGDFKETKRMMLLK
jgi:hypothetical protein